MATKACVADTSWVYALLDSSDGAHGDAVAYAETADAIFIPLAVLVETIGLVGYRVRGGRSSESKRAAVMRQAVDRLASKSNMRLGEPPNDHDACMRVWDEHPDLGYVDACVVAAARAKSLELCTFDDAQSRALGRTKR